MLTFEKSDFNEFINKEWLVTNGLGGYASSTICGANTRRYHGLLVSAFNPPGDRRVIFSNLEEKLITSSEKVAFSTHQYPETVHPRGFEYIQRFERNPLPQTTFKFKHCTLNKTVFMVQEANTTVVEYENFGDTAFNLELNPLFVFRDYHGLFGVDDYFDFYHENHADNVLKIHPHLDSEAVYLAFSKGNFVPNSQWYHNFEYEKEKYRGLDYREDAKSLGAVWLSLAPGEKAFLAFSTEKDFTFNNPEAWKTAEIERLNNLHPEITDPFERDLAISGDQFIVHRQSADSDTLMAGYHWFMDWGRDTMIAMRGLTIALGKKTLSQSIIRTFLKYLDRGMLPNRFPDQGEEPEYNTFDATLWLFVVLYEYYEKFEDKDFIQEVFATLTEIINAHYEGTRFSIKVLESGLLFGGEGLSQLTWMDARIDDYVVTPRQGCPVEINALWFNALSIYRFFADLLKEEVTITAAQVDLLKENFKKYFLNEKGYLNDVVIPDEYIDDSVRPNQVYALSLPFSPLDSDEMKGIMDVIENELYTDLGLRSLSPKHPDFTPVYGGNPETRDKAYHQGTVWAFLWGEYALAYLKMHSFSEEAQQTIRNKAKVLEKHFYKEDGLYTISEIFDGENPGEGRGCVHQAWSIGMLLKTLI